MLIGPPVGLVQMQSHISKCSLGSQLRSNDPRHFWPPNVRPGGGMEFTLHQWFYVPHDPFWYAKLDLDVSGDKHRQLCYPSPQSSAGSPLVLLRLDFPCLSVTSLGIAFFSLGKALPHWTLFYTLFYFQGGINVPFLQDHWRPFRTAVLFLSRLEELLPHSIKYLSIQTAII